MCPNLVTQLGIAEPNQCTGGFRRQASNPNHQVAEVGPGVIEGYSLQSANTSTNGLVSLENLAKGATTNDAKFETVVLSSMVRTPHGIIELSGRTHKTLVKVLVDSRSTSNYISDQIVWNFGLNVKKEEDDE